MTENTTATKRRPDGAALIVAAVLAALGLLLIREGFSIPDKAGYAGIGSGGMPKVIGFGMLILSAGHVLAAFRNAKTVAADDVKPQFGPVLWIMAGLLLQLLLLRHAGFAIASGLLFACTAAGFGKRNLALTLPIGIALALLIYGIFDQLLKLKLPAGVLEKLLFGG
ncbi:C4-dicarboxylate ABC transporter [Cypionkella aquatica]|uniref:C4-dicarboxylate ABC transporter n=1 Tax=Cypionkella aquatica TaxID=1756042 RepID=A0AA37WZT9_9RHOB|nr:tripartite tricarboxylate transporter TctB family protein [Cypionkella aquatica]GLS86089.1 C4-dicarboxylate ABC transporter [Cypionkella aquatica]